MASCTIDQEGSVTVYVSSVTADEAYVTASVPRRSAEAGQTSEEAYGKIARILKRNNMQVVHERIFGSVSAQSAVSEARRRVMEECGLDVAWPTTYVQGSPVWGQGLAGILIQAIRPQKPADVWTVYSHGSPCGRGWKRNGLTFLILQNLHGLQDGPKSDNSRKAQAARMFERADKILREHGGTYRDVLRTWIYISDILGWYDEFNEVRNATYANFGLMPGASVEPEPQRVYLPASTGIEGDNPMGAATLMDALAVLGGPESRPEVAPMSNIKQKEAFKYGSAFSRGTAVRQADVTHLHISGTAAISDSGDSLFPGDAEAQILRTFDIVEALIGQQGAGLQDVCQATIFLKRPQDAATFQQVVAKRGLTRMPAVCVAADVCREELLFEMDGTAALRSRPAGTPPTSIPRSSAG